MTRYQFRAIRDMNLDVPPTLSGEIQCDWVRILCEDERATGAEDQVRECGSLGRRLRQCLLDERGLECVVLGFFTRGYPILTCSFRFNGHLYMTD